MGDTGDRKKPPEFSGTFEHELLSSMMRRNDLLVRLEKAIGTQNIILAENLHAIRCGPRCPDCSHPLKRYPRMGESNYEGHHDIVAIQCEYCGLTIEYVIQHIHEDRPDIITDRKTNR